MKQVDSIKRATAALQNIHTVLNEVCFESKLTKAQVTVEKVRGAYGAFWVRKQYYIYHSDDWEWKIAINPGHFTKDIDFLAGVLLHEMCHQYAAENGIQDCSRNGTYHNKEFKAIAERTGLLTVERLEKYGWTDTRPNEKMLELCIERGWENFQFSESYAAFDFSGGDDRGEGESETPSPRIEKPKQSTRKHVCPQCGAIARTTKDFPLICGLCRVDMVQQ